MKVVAVLFALVAGSWAATVEYEAAYFPVESRPIGTPSLKITNGKNAEFGQFPYQVSVQRRNEIGFNHICGGAIIGQRWVLTAAHCVSEGRPEDFQVRAGSIFLDDDHVEHNDVEWIAVHPRYPGGAEVDPNDIALLRLRHGLFFNELVHKVDLPRPEPPRGDAVLAGWGFIRPDGSIHNHLQFVVLPIRDERQCREELDDFLRENNPFDNELNICTGLFNNGEAACKGDSGGALVQDNQVVGISSWGLVPCGENNAPSVYVKVSSFVEWIFQVTEGDL